MKEVNLELMPKQYEFIMSDAKYALYAGGLGGGKTHGLCVWTAIMINKFPNCKGILTANTYRQLQDATIPTLMKVLDSMSIPYKYTSGQKQEFTVNGTVLHCRSMENYDALRGSEYGWAACDEAAFYKREAWNVLVARIRDKKGPCQVKLATTTQGFNWLYDTFVLEATDNHFVVYSSSRDNHHLPEDYVDTLLEQYDDRLAEQELEGRFVNLTSGKCYYSFDRNTHVIEKPEVGIPWYGCDFNVNPITAVKGFITEVGLHITDEIYIKDSNTYELAKRIAETENAGVIPDSTGKGRKTSAVRTDHQILKDANLNVIYSMNPHVKDRYNCMNGLIKHGRLTVDPKCKMLIKDLEQMTHENKDPMISHISDALGYLAWYFFPLRAAKKPSRNIPLRGTKESEGARRFGRLDAPKVKRTKL